MNANATYKSLADGLPPEFARQLHPDWFRNEAEYWAVRDELLGQYQNQWIGFANGKVIASGKRPVQVLHASKRAASHSFFVCVGREYEPTRMRRSTFPYDMSYVGEPLPVVQAEFRGSQGSPGVVLDNVILDTGSDASALPWADCQSLSLDPAEAMASSIIGVGDGAINTLEFGIWVVLDGTEHECRLHIDAISDERILGRDVLNYMDVLFRGPAAEVIINP